MLLLDKRIVVRAPAGEVFRFLAAVERLPQWFPGERRAAWLNERRGLGALVHREGEACATRLSWTEVVEDWQPGRRLGWRQVQGDWVRNRGAWEVARVGRSTLVRLLADLELPHALDVEMTYEEADRALSRGLDLALLNLKDALERQRAPAPLSPRHSLLIDG